MEKQNEDYLLGKMYQPKEEEKSDLHKLKSESSAAGSLWLNKISSKNDTFSRLHEDPMLFIQQQEAQARLRITSNPLKMAKIKAEADRQVHDNSDLTTKDKKAAKRALKKEKKRVKKEAKKEKKRQKRARSVSSSSSSSSGDSTMPSVRKDISIIESKEDVLINIKTGKRNDSRDRERGSQRDRDRRHRSRSTSRRCDSRDRRHRERSRSRSRDRGRNNYSSSRDNRRTSDSSRSNRSTTEDVRQKVPEVGEKKYGLVKGSGGAVSDGGRSHLSLGPRADLIESKEAAMKSELMARLGRKKESVAALSEEQKQRRLREMQEAADLKDLVMQKLHENDHKETTKTTTAVGGQASFLASMRSEVYSSSDTTMADRLNQNKHYTQKGEDLDKFLSR